MIGIGRPREIARPTHGYADDARGRDGGFRQKVAARVVLRSGGSILSLTASESDSNQHPALLEREDCTLVAWYPSLYAPRAGGAYDSHHRTAGIAGRTRRSGRVAARGARAAAEDAGDRGPHLQGVRRHPTTPRRVPSRSERHRLYRGSERQNRISLRRESKRTAARIGG